MVFQTRHRRLRTQVTVIGKMASAYFQHAVVAECIAVIRILIPCRYLEHTLDQHFLQTMYNEVFIPPFHDVRCQTREKTLAQVYTMKKMQTTERGQVQSRK
jgi:hypothetical protein